MCKGKGYQVNRLQNERDRDRVGSVTGLAVVKWYWSLSCLNQPQLANFSNLIREMRRDLRHGVMPAGRRQKAMALCYTTVGPKVRLSGVALW